jgi:cytochrome c biogenesis protein CcdA
VIDGAFAYAFTVGMVSTVNPCGFAMLPAYLSFFLGLEGAGKDARASLSRALAVALCVSAGFALTFGALGVVIVHLTDRVNEWARWFSVAIGVGLVVLGIAMLAGYEPKLRLPRLDAGGRDRGVVSMVLYGVSYAVVSIGCTMPIFLPLVAGTFRSESALSGVAIFLTYAAGFAVLLTALTVTLALAERSLVSWLRRALPYIQKVSGALLVIAGAYVAYYGWYEIDRIGEEDAVVDRVTGWSNEITAWISDRGATQVGLILALVVAAAALFVAAGRRSAR